MGEDIFEVFLMFRNISQENIDQEFKRKLLWTNIEGLRLLKTLFMIIKNEMEEVVSLIDLGRERDNRKKKLKIMKNKFSESTDIDYIENCLVKQIAKLKKFSFRKGVLTVNLDEISDSIELLREKRINFWEDLLNTFRNDKSTFTEDLRKL